MTATLLPRLGASSPNGIVFLLSRKQDNFASVDAECALDIRASGEQVKPVESCPYIRPCIAKFRS
jgi:hypothetical protein